MILKYLGFQIICGFQFLTAQFLKLLRNVNPFKNVTPIAIDVNSPKIKIWAIRHFFRASVRLPKLNKTSSNQSFNLVKNFENSHENNIMSILTFFVIFI